MSALLVLRREITARFRLWLALTFGLFASLLAAQLVLLMLRFQTFPNYLVVHDWPGNIARIVRKTPSFADAVAIMLDEWLIEIGSISYAYGRGIAEWSFVVIPAKAGVLLIVALLLATIAVLLLALRRACALPMRLAASFGALGGAAMAAMASMTITWVVCCAAPTWIVGLAVLGVSVATAFALQPIGGWLTALGIGMLCMIVLALIGLLSERDPKEAAAPIATQLAGMPS
jgi:hypothetical protein